MTTQTAEAVPETVRPWQPFRCRVQALRRLSPSFLRVTFGAEGLRHFADNGFDQRIKLIFPAPACGFDKLPVSDRWYSELRALPDDERCRVRTYTVRAVRRDLGEVDVDMVIHEPESGCDAPALRWALGASVGDELVLLGPDARFGGVHGGIDFHAPAGAELLIGGDETAAPAIAAILERLPTTARGRVFIEVPTAADALELDRPPQVEVHWLARGGAWGERLVPAVTAAAEGLDLTPQPQEVDEIDVDRQLLWEAPEQAGACGAYAWVAAEAGAVKSIRRTLRRELGLPKECGAFMGYWRAGRAAD
ncbi:siderophore-interacting protein [Glycomyces xiaoerkulensis]|uniref:siderophore-interacting protein n=1 Tax=Glycomyces xiaoerkulensis TaxID=2038139 RepID=UPI001E5F8D88|nr:siderophore-interacting protein [Glycomyces xiaoerkulensis]